MYLLSFFVVFFSIYGHVWSVHIAAHSCGDAFIAGFNRDLQDTSIENVQFRNSRNTLWWDKLSDVNKGLIINRSNDDVHRYQRALFQGICGVRGYETLILVKIATII